MSILDTLRGALGGAESPGARLAVQALDLLQDNQHGGLGGLLARFEQAGLGDAVKSWVGTGANQSISADDVQRVLDPQRLRDMAQQAGIPMDRLPSELANLLPQLVDKLTPNGHLPDSPLLAQAFSLLRSTLGR